MQQYGSPTANIQVYVQTTPVYAINLDSFLFLSPMTLHPLLNPDQIAQLTVALAQPNPHIPLGEADGIVPAQLEEAVSLLRDLVFPGYFTSRPTVECLSKLSRILLEQVRQALLVAGEDCCSRQITTAFMECIPEFRRLIGLDVEAIFEGDPASTRFSEVILCYPSVKAILHYRMANALLRAKVPILPRIISELAHAQTGIDIHPGAQIGEAFAIDHGTGVVIGETCIIGRNVRLYQGVTLGARSFRKAEDGSLMNVPRHPIIEDNVVIYSNATVLGRITIGHDSVIGGNVWCTQAMPPYSRMLQSKTTLGTTFENGEGI